MFKLLHYDGKNGEILHEVEKPFFVCVFFSFPKSYVNFISFFFPMYIFLGG